MLKIDENVSTITTITFQKSADAKSQTIKKGVENSQFVKSDSEFLI